MTIAEQGRSTMTFADAVAKYGASAKQRLSGPGEREALLVTPVAQFIQDVGALTGLTAVAHDEVAELDGAVRPDFGVRVDGLLVGHIELKAPGTSLDPTTYTKSSHNFTQWQRLKELPNLLHTNGTEFKLWRYGELVDEPVNVHAKDLVTFKGALTAPSRFELIVKSFLGWQPAEITSVTRLVETLAPLARLLRETVHDALRAERRALSAGAEKETLPFTGIKADWRRLLFPLARDDEFSDGFAQTVVFALLLAVSEETDLKGKTILEVAKSLEVNHTLMGKALNLLTEHVGNTPTWSAIEIILRSLSTTQWSKLAAKSSHLYLHLYEDFLASYDPKKRRDSGSYYTPVEVVDAMVRMTDDLLKSHLEKPEGLRNPFVSTVDPAMGTGTFPLSMLRHVADAAAKQYGPGAAPEAVSNAAARIFGIELQSGPFSVAELRVASAIREQGAALPKGGLNLYVADTLEDPYSASDQQLSYTAQLIAKQRQQANKMKRERNVQVCIGNPPYADHAGGVGGWIESGTDPATGKTPLDAFRLLGNGKHERHLSNLYAYFWRWATWKVFESTNQPDIKDGGSGLVCFITATGYLVGPGFKGMRQYLREMCSHGWIINVTPEGKQPPSKNAVFNIETPVAIAIFLRSENTDRTEPAKIRYIDVEGTREEKFADLATLSFDDDRWREVRDAWTAPFTPAAATEWDDYPALDDVLPWRAAGVMAGRGWVYAPSRDVLEMRLRELVSESTAEEKSRMFKEGRDASLAKTKKPLAGDDTEQGTRSPFSTITILTDPRIVRCGFRAFDRQYLVADSRLLSQPSPSLWAARRPGQILAIELHSEYPRGGPAIVFTNLIPDVHHFRGSGGGRAIPKLHPDGSHNLAEGLVAALSDRLGAEVVDDDVFAYVAGVAAHPGFTAQFDDELHTPGVRIPMTVNAALFARAVAFGKHVQWLHTFGAVGTHPDGFTDVRDERIAVLHPSYAIAVGTTMPTSWSYSEDAQSLHVGSGRWDGVKPEVMSYTVGGTPVLESWLGYRMAKPKKRTGSPLDAINAVQWDPDWSVELSNLLSVLTQLLVLEEEQVDLLSDIVVGALLTKADLAALGVKWPVGDKRSPRSSSVGTLMELDGEE